MGETQTQGIGRRLRSARRQRGMSLRALAGRSGLSAGFLSMVENGHRQLERTAHINALAEALRIAPTELTGQPYPPLAPSAGVAHEAIPALRLALMGIHPGIPAQRRPLGGPLPLPLLGKRVAEANRLYHAGEYAALAQSLPVLLARLHADADAAGGLRREALLRLLADTYHPACTLLLKNLGYTDLAFIAVTRAAEAVAELDDPVYQALSGFFHTHVLMAAGSPVQALATAEEAARLVERNLSGPPSYSLLGELHLIRATCLTQDRTQPGTACAQDVQAHLSVAAELAGRTGETKAWHLNFGPTNVGIHQVSLNAELGRHGKAVEAGGRVDPRVLAAPGREAAFHADLGRALSHLRGQTGAAVAALLAAEQAAPQRIRASALVRQTVADLLSRQLPSWACRDLRGLAHRVGIPS